jgi:predicted  nucleic acid-binding Zn-ribbon protein
MLKQEINSLNVFVLTLTPKLDFEKTQGEVRKINAQITDIEYNLQDLTAKINDVDQRGESFATFQRLENQKFTERLDKLEANVAQIRNIIGKISEQLKAGFAQNDNQD